MKLNVVAPIHTGGVAVRHVGASGCNLNPALDLDVLCSWDWIAASRSELSSHSAGQ